LYGKECCSKNNVSDINSDCIANKTSSISAFNKAVMNINNDKSDSDEDNSVIISSDCYAAIAMDDDDTQLNELDLTPSPIDKLPALSTGTIQVVPIESSTFHRNFMPEEHFMINLCNVCKEANAPLDLVDNVVKVFCDTQSNGLNLESNVVHSCEYFLKHLNQQFNTPVPESVTVKVEDQNGNDQMISVIWQNFLSQAIDLIHDHEIWGDKNNFIGTVPMDDPYSSFKHGKMDNKVDEVADGFWYKQTIEECAKLLMENDSWCWDWFFTVTKQELMCINKIHWSHSCLHSVYLMESIDIKLQHGVCLDTFLI